MASQALEASVRSPLISIPRQIIKRDGKSTPFDVTNIRSAIRRAGGPAASSTLSRPSCSRRKR